LNKGIVAAVITYTLWGLLPVYWKALQAVPALEILGHRMVWSCLFVLLLLTARKQWDWIRRSAERRTALTFGASASLLALNWFTYIWAVNAGHIVDASLGYFINPLISVLLGVIFLQERLRPWQGVAIGLATVGVVFLTVGYGAFPWIALTLALTFGFYGLLRKTAPLGSLEGLAMETALMSVPALAFLLYLAGTGAGSFGRAGLPVSALLAGAGLVTAVPLLLFAYAARRVTLATVGILQYIAPTLQFLLGVFVYHEPFSQTRLVGFVAIWLALALYSIEGLAMEKRRRAGTIRPG
jgi:chloramphenicol-sensitive protein RarD